MQLGFHFGFKKSKAYGLCGVMLVILFLGMSGHSAKADEMLSPTDTSSTLKESTENHSVLVKNFAWSTTLSFHEAYFRKAALTVI